MALQTGEGVPFDKDRLKAWRIVASLDDCPIEAHIQATPAEMTNIGRLLNLGAIGHAIAIDFHDLGPVADQPAPAGPKGKSAIDWCDVVYHAVKLLWPSQRPLRVERQPGQPSFIVVEINRVRFGVDERELAPLPPGKIVDLLLLRCDSAMGGDKR